MNTWNEDLLDFLDEPKRMDENKNKEKGKETNINHGFILPPMVLYSSHHEYKMSFLFQFPFHVDHLCLYEKFVYCLKCK